MSNISDLQNGIIPDHLREALRLIPETTDDARYFQQTMEAMTAEILGADIAKKLGARFFLQDEPYQNAGVLTGSNPPVIVFTRGLLEALQPERLQRRAADMRAAGERVPDGFELNSKGMLLAILAHEIRHVQLGTGNSKGIEAACDDYAVERLIALGYRKDSLIEAFKFMFRPLTQEQEKIFASYKQYLDVHPRTDNRVRLMENRFFHDIEGQGKVKFDADDRVIEGRPAALEPKIFDFTAARYQSLVERLLEERQYFHQTKPEQLAILRGILMEHAPHWRAKDHDSRIEQLTSCIKNLSITNRSHHGTPAHDEINRIIDTVLNIDSGRKPHWYAQSIYRQIAQEWTADSFSYFKPLVPLGKYETYAAQINAFIHARTAEEATAAAVEIEKLNLPRHYGDAKIEIDLPAFKIPKAKKLLDVSDTIYQNTNLVTELDAIDAETAAQSGILPAWQPHVEWAVAENDPAHPIARVLQKLGVSEKIAPQLAPLTSVLGNPESLGSIAAIEDNIIAAPNGYLVGMKYKENRYSTDKNYDQFDKRMVLIDARKKQNINLDAVDWDRVRSGDASKFKRFVERYSNELLPNVRKQTPPTPFEQRFIQEIEHALSHSAKAYGFDEYKKQVGEFFTNTLVENVTNIAKNHEVSSNIRINREHPYIVFVGKNPSSLFSQREKAKIVRLAINAHDYRSAEIRAYDVANNMDFFRGFFGYTEPTHTTELFAVLDGLNRRKQSFDSHSHTEVLSYIADNEVANVFARGRIDYVSPAQLASLYALGKRSTGEGLRDPYEGLLSTYVQNNYQRDFALDVEKLIDAYSTHSQSLFFREQVELRSMYEKTIMEKVDAVPYAHVRQQLLEKLLLNNTEPAPFTDYFADSYKRESPKKFISDPDFRDWAVSRWVESAAIHIASQAGNAAITDNGSREYRKVAEKEIEKVIEHSDGITRHNLLIQLLDHTEAQQEVSYFVRDRLNDVAFGQVAKLHLHAAAGEVFLDHLAFDPKLRMQSMEFLKAPLTETSARDYAKQVRRSAEKMVEYNAFGHVPAAIKDKLREALKKTELYDPGFKISAHAAQILHKNFTSAPMEYRTFMMEKVLFPPNLSAKPMSVDPQDYVFDKALPLTDEYAKYGRSLLGNYLSALKPEEEYVRRMYLSALLVAEEPGSKETDPQKRVGKAIHTLLGGMDNALAGKTSQAIDSAPGIPDWLRNPESKVGTNIPPRWVIHEMFEQCASKDIKKTTLHLGKVRAGAIGIAVELEKNPKIMGRHGYPAPSEKTIFKMLRRGAPEKVTLNAPRVKQMIAMSAQEYPELKSAKPIIDHALSASKIETRFTNAPLQTAIASRLTDGVVIDVEGESFTFRETPILKANEIAHEMAWAPGTVFNELPKERKATVARALFTMENYLALSGYQVDWDRHGAQAIIEGNEIHLIDRGGMALEPPTREEKALLGQVLGSAFNDYILNGTPFEQSFSHAVDVIAEPDGSINHYVATIARGQHNLGDLRRELTPEQQIDAMISVFAGGQVDPVIQESALNALAPAAQIWLAQKMMPLMSQGSTIQITDPNLHRHAELLQVDGLREVVKVSSLADEASGTKTILPAWLTKLFNNRKISSSDIQPRPVMPTEWKDRVPASKPKGADSLTAEVSYVSRVSKAGSARVNGI